MVYLTRKAEFSASHFYHNPDFTPEENQRIFGKCNNPNGHGHNYTLEVTVKGAVDPKSGFVVDLKQLKDVMSREVLEAFDHRFLNKEVPEFLTKIPTTENLAIVMKIFVGKHEDQRHEGAPHPPLHVFGFAPPAQR
jgi:6-pyruvoyltetrahydropterin/6-carboxytetrahydropterin synthase